MRIAPAGNYAGQHQEPAMPDLNDATPQPPEESRARLQRAEEESRKLDSPQRTNESTVDPEKPPKDILEGFHGG
jgi:hypothetical protein